MGVRWRSGFHFQKAGQDIFWWYHNYPDANYEFTIQAIAVSAGEDVGKRGAVSSSQVGTRAPNITDASIGPDVDRVPFVLVRSYEDTVFYNIGIT